MDSISDSSKSNTAIMSESSASDYEDSTFPYLRKEEEQEVSEPLVNEWDDTQLTTEYDRAIKIVKQQAIRKIQAELGLLNEDVQDLLSDVSSEKKKKKSNKKKMNTADKIKWAVGMPCRAKYSEDGQEYEAEILYMTDDHHCMIRYIGYENEEEVKLKKLIPSLGKQVIDLQIESAKAYHEALQGTLETEEEKQCFQNDRLSMFDMPIPNKYYRNFSHQRSPLVSNIPPPPPPLPPSFHGDPSHVFAKQNQQSSSSHQNLTGAPHIPAPQMSTGNKALDSMLLSWYMCGYYTGYYQRQIHSG